MNKRTMRFSLAPVAVFFLFMTLAIVSTSYAQDFQKYFKRTDRIITSPALLEILNDGNDQNNPLLLDVRSKENYEAGTIPNAIWISGYTKMTEPENLKKLDAALEEHSKKTGNKKIVTWCGSGHGGSQAAAALGSLGYETIALKYGFSGWVASNKDFLAGSNPEKGPVIKP